MTAAPAAKVPKQECWQQASEVQPGVAIVEGKVRERTEEVELKVMA